MKPSEKRIGFERLMELLDHGWSCEECRECEKDPSDGCRRDNCPIWASLPEVEVAHDIDIFMITVNAAHKNLLAAVERQATRGPETDGEDKKTFLECMLTDLADSPDPEKQLEWLKRNRKESPDEDG